MPDVREQILARLVAIAAEVPVVATAGRNRIGLFENARPAIIVLDADEAAEEEEEERTRSWTHMLPAIFASRRA
jgi:hypothetical protein